MKYGQLTGYDMYEIGSKVADPVCQRIEYNYSKKRHDQRAFFFKKVEMKERNSHKQ